MSNSIHVRYEILRTLRNPLTLGFTLGLPLVVFLAIAGTNRHGTLQGISVTLYFMGAMAAYGAMLAAVQPGARIALDRSKGWTRQLRITPLRSGIYFFAKILAAYLVVLVILSALFVAGTALGAHMAGVRWLELAALLLIGLAPFVVLGIALGHLLTPASLSAVVGGLVAVLAMLGGAFGPLFTHGAMLSLVKLLPSYWLVQASRVSVGGGGWPVEAWLVVLSWTAAMILLALAAYRRDTARV
jgi:ABC-2 type transport system permease protein